MMDYGPYYVLYKLKKLRADVAYLLGVVSYLLKVIAGGGPGGGGIILRDAPSDPEPAPDIPQKACVLAFRNQAPWKIWDPDNAVWLD